MQNRLRLCNVKTRRETGLDYVTQSLEIGTPFGKEVLKNLEPFYPGDEALLREELKKVSSLICFSKENPLLVSKLKEVFMEMKNLNRTISKCDQTVLSVVELYEIKSLLLQLRQIRKIICDFEVGDYTAHCCNNSSVESNEIKVVEIPDCFKISDVENILDILDPTHDRINTFYIYDEFSHKLGTLRKMKRDLEVELRKEQKKLREEIRNKYHVELTPKFDINVSKSNDNLEMIKEIPLLEVAFEDYMSITFQLKSNDNMYDYVKKMEDMNLEIEEEEEKIRKHLTSEISKYKDVILENCEIIGKLDFTLSKALFSIKYDLIEPEITDEHVVEIVDGRNIQVESIIKEKGKTYTPVSITLNDGVTVITGANMGGKTISLKLSGQVPILAQYGFFVGAKYAKVGLSNFIQILIGDSQSVERGLSSFGSEMEELKEILDHGTDRSIILIDEIASGTNPTEGTALTKSLIDYLTKKPYISLITTHFETVTDRDDVTNMQVMGLSNADFRKLNLEIMDKNRRERINIISKYMDYRLCKVEKKGQVPKDALNIASMLGINKEIIEGAKKYIK